MSKYCLRKNLAVHLKEIGDGIAPSERGFNTMASAYSHNPAHPRIVHELSERRGERMLVVGSDIDSCLMSGYPMLGQIECHNRFFEGHVLHHLYHRATIVVSVSGGRGDTNVRLRQRTEQVGAVYNSGETH